MATEKLHQPKTRNFHQSQQPRLSLKFVRKLSVETGELNPQTLLRFQWFGEAVLYKLFKSSTAFNYTNHSESPEIWENTKCK
jgi:hypothetical protein